MNFQQAHKDTCQSPGFISKCGFLRSMLLGPSQPHRPCPMNPTVFSGPDWASLDCRLLKMLFPESSPGIIKGYLFPQNNCGTFCIRTRQNSGLAIPGTQGQVFLSPDASLWQTSSIPIPHKQSESMSLSPVRSRDSMWRGRQARGQLPAVSSF